MKPFNCEQCRSRICFAPAGQITECEHHPLQPLEPWPRNQRTDFLRLVAELVREENVVTKSVIRQIIKGRIDREDLS